MILPNCLENVMIIGLCWFYNKNFKASTSLDVDRELFDQGIRSNDHVFSQFVLLDITEYVYAETRV